MQEPVACIASCRQQRMWTHATAVPCPRTGNGVQVIYRELLGLLLSLPPPPPLLGHFGHRQVLSSVATAAAAAAVLLLQQRFVRTTTSLHTLLGKLTNADSHNHVRTGASPPAKPTSARGCTAAPRRRCSGRLQRGCSQLLSNPGMSSIAKITAQAVEAPARCGAPRCACVAHLSGALIQHALCASIMMQAPECAGPAALWCAAAQPPRKPPPLRRTYPLSIAATNAPRTRRRMRRTRQELGWWAGAAGRRRRLCARLAELAGRPGIAV